MIIGLTGKKQVGKDTIADYLVANYEFKKAGFSDLIYDGVCNLWGITLEEAHEYKTKATVAIHVDWDGSVPSEVLSHNFTWREFLQRFGTEMGRHTFGHDFWVDRFFEKYIDHLNDTEYDDLRLVIRDVRFNNEAQAIVDLDGEVWEVNRPSIDDGDEHISEMGIRTELIHGEIYNDEPIEELYPMLDEWMSEYGLSAKSTAS